MKKRFTTLMTTLILSVFFTISASAFDVEVDDIYYNLVDKGKVAEVVSGYNLYKGDIIIPSSITVDEEIYTVIKIQDEAFKDCNRLSSVSIPNTVTSIGYSAFSGCKYLSSITIPNSVTTIGNLAFSNCMVLISIKIPESVASIGYGAFSGCI